MRVKDGNKQQRIKDATVCLFLREGMDGTSIAKIAREAGVSPATIYIYYPSKEEMLAEVFREYSRQSYRYVLQRIEPDMDAGSFIETLVRSSYSFSVEYREIFSFIEQCSRCPSLSRRVCEQDCGNDLMDVIHAYQARDEICECSDTTLWSLLFAPVRSLAMTPVSETERDGTLDELVDMLRNLLIR